MAAWTPRKLTHGSEDSRSRCLGPSGAWAGELLPCWAPRADLGNLPKPEEPTIGSSEDCTGRLFGSWRASCFGSSCCAGDQVSNTAIVTRTGTGAYRCCCLYSNLYRARTDCLCRLFTSVRFARPLAEDGEEDLLTPQHSLKRCCQHSYTESPTMKRHAAEPVAGLAGTLVLQERLLCPPSIQICRTPG